MEGDNNKIRHHKITGKCSVDRPTELTCAESIDGPCVEGSETKTQMVVASAEESIVQQVFPGQWATFALSHSAGVKPRTLPMLGKYPTTNLHHQSVGHIYVGKMALYLTEHTKINSGGGLLKTFLAFGTEYLLMCWPAFASMWKQTNKRNLTTSAGKISLHPQFQRRQLQVLGSIDSGLWRNKTSQ